MNDTHSAVTEAAFLRRSVSRIALFLLGTMVVGVAVASVLVTLNGQWPATLSQGTLTLWAAYALFPALALWLNRRGFSVQAIGLMIAGMMIVMLAVDWRISGYGLIQSVGLVLLTAFIAGQTRLASRQAAALIAASIVVGVAVLVLDVYGPTTRPVETAEFQNLVGLFAAGLVIVFGVFSLRHWREYKLRTKLLIGLAAVGIVAGPLLGFIALRSLQDNLTQSVGESLKALAVNKALNVGNQIQSELDLLQTFSTGSSVQDELLRTNGSYSGDVASIHDGLRSAEAQFRGTPNSTLLQGVVNDAVVPDLREFQKQFPDNADLLLTDKYGAAVAATSHISDFYYGDQLWWQQASNLNTGGLYISQPQYDPGVKAPVLMIATPVRDQAAGNVAGILVVTYRLTTLTSTLAQGLSGMTGGADILTPSGAILRSQGNLETLNADALVQIRTSPDATYLETDYARGTPSLVSQASATASTGRVSQYLQQLNWVVVVNQERSEALAAVAASARGGLATGLVVFLLAGVLAVIVAQFLSNPITRLTTVAAHVAEGDLTVQAPVESTDEIGILATTFNRMTAQLRQTLEGLEQRVAERTAQLSEASATLSRQNEYLTSLHDTTLGLMGRLELQDLLQTIIARAGALLGTAHGYVFLHDPGASEIEMRVGIGVYTEFVGSRARRGAGLAGIVWQTGAELVVDDYQHWEQRLPDPRRDVLRAVAGVPVTSGGQTVGVIGLAYLDEGRHFGKNEMETLNRFAQLASVAIDNARSFERQAALAQENRQLFERARQANEKLTELAGENRQLLERAQEANEELTALTRRLTGESWDRYLTAQQEKLLVEDAAPQIPASEPNWSGLDRAAASADVDISTNGHSAVALPLVLRDQVIGALELEDLESSRTWSEEDIAMMRQVAVHVALALDNARLYSDVQQELNERKRAETEIRRRNEELAAINLVTSRASTLLDTRSLLEATTREMVKLFHARNSGIALLNAERTQLEVVADSSREQDEASAVGVLIPLANNPSSLQAIETGQVVLVVDPQHNPLTEPIHALMAERHTECLLIVPLRARGEVIGTLGLDSDEPGRVFSEREAELAETIAGQIAAALENARLFEQTQARAQREHLTREIVAQVSRSIDRTTILKTAARQLGQALGASRLVVRLNPAAAPANGDTGPRTEPINGNGSAG